MSSYKYDPINYDDSPGLRAEMEDFYGFLERYKQEKTQSSLNLFDKQRRDLFFSIKHRVVEGYFSETKAQEMRDYFGELFDEEQSYG